MIKIADVKAYNVQEAAELLDVSPQTIRSYIKQGKLKAQKAGRAFYITESTLEAYIKGEYTDNAKEQL